MRSLNEITQWDHSMIYREGTQTVVIHKFCYICGENVHRFLELLSHSTHSILSCLVQFCGDSRSGSCGFGPVVIAWLLSYANQFPLLSYFACCSHCTCTMLRLYFQLLLSLFHESWCFVSMPFKHVCTELWVCYLWICHRILTEGKHERLRGGVEVFYGTSLQYNHT